MRSYIAASFDPPNEHLYTDLMVLRSAAGFYIGTAYNNPDGYQEPGTRDSGYYATEEQALADLNSESWLQRMHP